MSNFIYAPAYFLAVGFGANTLLGLLV